VETSEEAASPGLWWPGMMALPRQRPLKTNRN
jgi:hypothetical protein